MDIKVVRKEVDLKLKLMEYLKEFDKRPWENQKVSSVDWENIADCIDRIYTNPETGEVEIIEFEIPASQVVKYMDCNMSTVMLTKEQYEQIKKAVEG